MSTAPRLCLLEYVSILTQNKQTEYMHIAYIAYMHCHVSESQTFKIKIQSTIKLNTSPANCFT